MRKPFAFPISALLCALVLAGCAGVTGQQLASTFDSGVKAYDAGDYPAAYKIWSSIDDYDLAAMRNVGMMLRTGQGVKKDPKKAEDLFEVAAEAGLPTAQADLADMLLKGEAGPPDPAKALPLLEAAAAANHPVAQYELAQMFETGQGGLVPQDLTVARRLYAASASHGMKDAQTRLDALGPEPKEEPMTPAPPGPVPPASAQPINTNP